MLTKEEENKICMDCGKCCMCYWIFTNIPEEVERFETLPTIFIEVQKIKNLKLWKIIFKLTCKYCIIKPDSVKCGIYTEKRPTYCPEYPRNFLEKNVEKEVLEHEKSFCPLLRKLTEVSGDSSQD